MWIWIFLYANVFILSGRNKLYKVIKLRAQVVFFLCVRTLQRLGSAGHPVHHCSHCAFLWGFLGFFLGSLKRFPCVVSQPHFFSLPNSRSPITRSNLEFTASNNCLMDPHVYTVWHWHADSVMKVPNQYYCFMLPPCLKKNRREKKKGRKKGKATGTFFLVLRGAVNGPAVSATSTLSRNFGKDFFHLL